MMLGLKWTMEEVEDMSILQEKTHPPPPPKNYEVIRGRYLQKRRERCVLHEMPKKRWGNREGTIYSTKKKRYLRAKCKDIKTPSPSPLPPFLSNKGLPGKVMLY